MLCQQQPTETVSIFNKALAHVIGSPCMAHRC